MSNNSFKDYQAKLNAYLYSPSKIKSVMTLSVQLHLFRGNLTTTQWRT